MNRVFLPPAEPDEVSVSTMDRFIASASRLTLFNSAAPIMGRRRRADSGSADASSRASNPASRNMRAYVGKAAHRSIAERRARARGGDRSPPPSARIGGISALIGLSALASRLSGGAPNRGLSPPASRRQRRRLPSSFLPRGVVPFPKEGASSRFASGCGFRGRR